VCLIRETKKTRSVGVPPGTGLGNTVLWNTKKLGLYILKTFCSQSIIFLFSMENHTGLE